MVYDGGVKDQEGSSSASPASAAAAATARAGRPPRPGSDKRLGVRHPLKHRRFRAGGTEVMVEAGGASSSGQAVAEARDVGLATAVVSKAGKEPEIQEQEIDGELEFLILASDGLWDVVPNEHAVAFVKAEEGPEAAARKLTEIAFARGSTDNITCIVVEFHHDKMGNDSPSSSDQS